MIEFISDIGFELTNQQEVSKWIEDVIQRRGYELGEVLYTFCDDQQLLKMNREFLNHDTYTDIISFDYTLGKQIHGEIFISVDRVRENAEKFKATFDDELHRVIIHGILHYCGLKDKTKKEQEAMREAENKALSARGFVKR
ncbi:rRNA maturation RNase YbeY [Altibacter sp. HG106]|uniref:rRNA maturation RNase YbeY n=1 Tax=Altibacter sp. HG106 TaxID=3023937 RepID=UPI0023507403|nr:rRNA maturation RNase YbeY [Altibacter sp. HG106]MDC7994986.1 rRNA maturation RNase YbeY [Altibacter sp. HG106]